MKETRHSACCPDPCQPVCCPDPCDPVCCPDPCCPDTPPYKQELKCSCPEPESRCDKSRYTVDLPYPSMDSICPNRGYAAAIKPMYSGVCSELTAILQYFYASCRLKDGCFEVYQALKYVSIVEMEHMEILAKLILALGGDICYTYKTRGGESFWSGGNVAYSKTPRQIMLESIEAERNAIRGYESLCCQIADEQVTCIIKRIILDEKRHLELFEHLYKTM